MGSSVEETCFDAVSAEVHPLYAGLAGSSHLQDLFPLHTFTVLTIVCARPEHIISIQLTVSRNVREMPVKNLTSNLLRRLPCTSRRQYLDVVRSVYVKAGA
jgi:hypothetical protein